MSKSTPFTIDPDKLPDKYKSADRKKFEDGLSNIVTHSESLDQTDDSHSLDNCTSKQTHSHNPEDVS